MWSEFHKDRLFGRCLTKSESAIAIAIAISIVIAIAIVS